LAWNQSSHTQRGSVDPETQQQLPNTSGFLVAIYAKKITLGAMLLEKVLVQFFVQPFSWGSKWINQPL